MTTKKVSTLPSATTPYNGTEYSLGIQSGDSVKIPVPNIAGSAGSTLVGHQPIGNISATTVAGAINELDTEKAPIASPTFTGTVSGISKAMVGLGNADNTSDINKPLSTATTNALALKADTSALPTAMSQAVAQAGTSTTAQTISAAVLDSAVEYGAFTPAGTGAVSRTVQSKLRDVVSVFDFMTATQIADVQSRTILVDVTSAIQVAIDYCVPLGKKIYFPSGTYRVDTTITLPDDITNSGCVNIFIGEGASKKATYILSKALSLFKTKTTPTLGANLISCYVLFSKIRFEGYYYSSTASVICFDKINLLGRITDCGFGYFDITIYGAVNGVFSFDHNSVQGNRLLKKPASYITVSSDSSFSFNYINGDGQNTGTLTTDPNVDLLDCAAMSFCNNYIDFSYIAIQVGGANSGINVSNNIIDISFIGIRHNYGIGNVIISNNTFTNIEKVKVSFFTNPVAGMSSTNWTCIDFNGPNHANIIISNNSYKIADGFIVFRDTGIWNVKETNNLGYYPRNGTPSPAQAITFSGRNIDTATYPLDNTLNYWQSLQDYYYTLIPSSLKSFIGQEYYIGTPPIKIIINSDYSLSDALGTYLWSKPNLLSSTNFSTGWTFNTGITQVAGVFTATAGNGWSYYPIALSIGTYIICYNVTSISNGTVSAGYHISGGAYSDSVASNITSIQLSGRFFAQLNVTSIGDRVGIYLPGGTNCTINYVHLIQIA